MAENLPNRPQGRDKYVTNNSKGVHRRGEGLGTGQVGRGESNVTGTNRPQAQRPSGGSGGGQTTRAGGKSSLLPIILLAVLLLGGGGGALSGLFGGGSTTTTTPVQTQSPASSIVSAITGNSSGGSILSSLLGSGIGQSALTNLMGASQASASSVSSWTETATAQATVDTSVAAGTRARYTTILGSGKDTVTIMVYMCGTDLESQGSMATKDLLEMTKAKLGGNVRIVVYTGGCTKWNNEVVSAKTNQIYEVVSGGLRCVQEDVGNLEMTKPGTLTSFIKWCAANYPANRNELIFWDHGGGSVSGYGYDQKFPKSGSMSLAGIDQALEAAGVKFDFIGFDACLMATVETGLMLNQYADYMVASEETEPGIGWYYTDWLSDFTANPSMATVQVGQKIVDSFVTTCRQECRGQSATLSVVDLAELDATAPSALKDFSKGLSSMISNKEYSAISTARSQTREFARSNQIDQIDLVHFAKNLGTTEGAALSKALLGAVKYNRTSSDMSNSYGLSIYFPYRKTSSVSAAVSTYNAIGMDESYSQCIREFATLEQSGQVTAAGGMTANPLGSLLGTLAGGSGSTDAISGLLGAFLGGSGMDFFTDRALSQDETVQYLSDHYFDTNYLVWQDRGDGTAVVSMPERQWELVTGLDLNFFVDDGEGFVDLGIDDVYEFDGNGYLLAPTDHLWLAVNGQPVAYYHEYTSGTTTTGRIPAFLNGELVDLIVVFDAEHPRGYLAGARTVYDAGETDTVAKNLTELNAGDTLDFVCDFYSYEGEYEDSYYLGEQMTVEENMELSYVDVGAESVRCVYRFTDIYQQHYWTTPFDS
ncbi:MAG: peptidase C11 [Oscillospiraceae bacterium]|nr:peptidase C11 [Oscillospiraceae bacterium]